MLVTDAVFMFLFSLDYFSSVYQPLFDSSECVRMWLLGSAETLIQTVLLQCLCATDQMTAFIVMLHRGPYTAYVWELILVHALLSYVFLSFCLTVHDNPSQCIFLQLFYI